MIQRYLIVSTVPELRAETLASDKGSPEIAVILPMPDYWEILELIKKMRYARYSNLSTEELWRLFSKKIYPCILLEKDRVWYKTNMEF